MAASKAAPSQLVYGHLGNGSTAAVAAAMLVKKKGLDLIDVPYAGYAPALTELLAERLAFCFVDGNSLSRIEQGSLRGAGRDDRAAGRAPARGRSSPAGPRPCRP